MSGYDRPTMPGREFRRVREHLGLTMDQFALELAYEGTRKNNRRLIQRFESGEFHIPLRTARLAWLMAQHGLPSAWPSGLEASEEPIAMGADNG